MYQSSSSTEGPGLRPRRDDTLNRRGPSSLPHRGIPMRAAQISSAIHTVFDARQLTTGRRLLPRPILPAPPTNTHRDPAPFTTSSQPLGDNNSLWGPNKPRHPPGFVMFEIEDGPESTPKQNSDLPIHQPGAMGPMREQRSSSRSRNPTDADWNQHRSIITRLYWDENLSMPVVREYMKREHGFDAT